MNERIPDFDFGLDRIAGIFHAILSTRPDLSVTDATSLAMASFRTFQSASRQSVPALTEKLIELALDVDASGVWTDDNLGDTARELRALISSTNPCIG